MGSTKRRPERPTATRAEPSLPSEPAPAPVGWRWHLLAVVATALAAVVTMRGWLDRDLLPGGDAPGYMSAVAYVHDALLRHGRVPRWCPKWFAGSTQLMSSLKEIATFPLALWLGPVGGTQLMFALTKVAAALGMYAIVVRFLGAPAVGIVAGYVYSFGALANHQIGLGGPLDVAVSYVLFPAIFLASAELLRSGHLGWAIALGALWAVQLGVHYAHAAVCAIILAVLLGLRPWRGTGEEPAMRARLVPLGAALAAFALFAAAQLAWLLADAGNHALKHTEDVARGLRVFVEQSPFLFVNRGDWLGGWLGTHAPPGLLLGDRLFNERRYLGLVALGVSLAGWPAARCRASLRRWYQSFALLLLLQYWLSLGPSTFVWEVARSFHWPEATDATVGLALTLAALACAGWGALLLARRRPAARVELAFGLALVLFAASHSLFDAARTVVPALAGVRAPGHFFELAPFAFAGLFAVALAALASAMPRGRELSCVAVVGGLVVLDFWPSTAAFHHGTSMGAMREAERMVAALPAEDGTLRLTMYLGAADLPGFANSVGSLVTASAPVGVASSWVDWQAGAHWEPYLLGTLSSLMGSLSARQRLQVRPIADVLCRIARIKYVLAERGSARLVIGEPWSERAATAAYAVWERPEVMPMAYGYRSYLLALGAADSVHAVYAAFQRNAAVISGGERLAETAEDVIDGAAVVAYTEAGAVADLESARLAQRHAATIVRTADPAQLLARLPAAPSAPLLDVRYQRPAPEAIDLDTDAGDAPAVVLVSEAYHPWWQATVDGRPAPVLRAEIAFMAVPVGPGLHRIELRLHRPLAVAAADAVTAGAWALLPLAALVHALWRRRRGDGGERNSRRG